MNSALFLLLMRMGTPGSVGQSGPLGGIWANVIKLDAGPQRIEMNATRLERVELEARDGNV